MSFASRTFDEKIRASSFVLLAMVSCVSGQSAETIAAEVIAKAQSAAAGSGSQNQALAQAPAMPTIGGAAQTITINLPMGGTTSDVSTGKVQFSAPSAPQGPLASNLKNATALDRSQESVTVNGNATAVVTTTAAAAISSGSQQNSSVKEAPQQQQQQQQHQQQLQQEGTQTSTQLVISIPAVTVVSPPVDAAPVPVTVATKGVEVWPGVSSPEDVGLLTVFWIWGYNLQLNSPIILAVVGLLFVARAGPDSKKLKADPWSILKMGKCDAALPLHDHAEGEVAAAGAKGFGSSYGAGTFRNAFAL